MINHHRNYNRVRDTLLQGVKVPFATKSEVSRRYVDTWGEIAIFKYWIWVTRSNDYGSLGKYIPCLAIYMVHDIKERQYT